MAASNTFAFAHRFDRNRVQQNNAYTRVDRRTTSPYMAALLESKSRDTLEARFIPLTFSNASAISVQDLHRTYEASPAAVLNLLGDMTFDRVKLGFLAITADREPFVGFFNANPTSTAGRQLRLFDLVVQHKRDRRSPSPPRNGRGPIAGPSAGVGVGPAPRNSPSPHRGCGYSMRCTERPPTGYAVCNSHRCHSCNAARLRGKRGCANHPERD